MILNQCQTERRYFKMDAYSLALAYYPRLWNKQRIQALVAAGRLTAEQAAEITGEEF